MRIDKCIEARIGPTADGLNNLLARVLVAGIETNKSIARVPCDNVAERLHHCKTVGDF